MRRPQKFLLVCCCMIGAGVFLSGIGYALGGRVWGISVGHEGIRVNTPNLAKESTVGYLEETIELEQFTSMQISVDNSDLVIEPSDHYGVSYCVDSAYDFSAEVVNGCLKITEKYPDSYVNIGNMATSGNFVLFGIGNMQGVPLKTGCVKVYVPADAAFDLVKLASDSSEVSGSGIRAEKFELQADYGNVRLEGLESENAVIVQESGNLELTDFSDGSLSIENGYGKAVLKNVKASDLAVTMESGDFESEGLQGESLLIKQAFGAVKLQDVRIAGAAEISNESGDIRLTNMVSKTLVLESDFGNIRGDAVSTEDGNFVLESGDCVMEELDIENLEIASDYGKVELEVMQPVESYVLRLATEYGRVKINGEDMGETYKSLDTQGRKLSVRCESGDITVQNTK